MSKRQGYVKSLGKLIRFVGLKLHTTLIQHFSCYHYCKGNLENFLFTHGQSSGTLMLKPAILEFHLFSFSVHPLPYPYMSKILSLRNYVSPLHFLISFLPLWGVCSAWSMVQMSIFNFWMLPARLFVLFSTCHKRWCSERSLRRGMLLVVTNYEHLQAL